MTVLFLCLAVAFLAYANGANDNFKGVASLHGSRTCGYRVALGWATVMTAAGSVASVFLASTLLKHFSGKGLVPDDLAISPAFLLAVAGGAGGTVLLATRLGFPISTTHGLTGALVGAGLTAGSGVVNFGMLGRAFVMPLLLSPLIAVVAGGIIYLVLRGIRRGTGIQADTCVCVGDVWHPVTSPSGEAAMEAALTMTVADAPVCERRYRGRVLGVEAGRVVDSLHFLSAGAVSFARGLNDTPKIAALLMAASAFRVEGGLLLVAIAMAAGGLLNSRRIADTMSHRITGMNPGQGFAANLSTALLVTTASLHGMPVSTTHVSVGSLLGMGVVTRRARWRTVLPILASWVVTLPVAAALAGTLHLILKTFPTS